MASKLKFKDDPRTPKLVGVLIIFVALYLIVACLSYIFTWKEDQDKVWEFQMGLISQDIAVANILGRLGAIVSHFLIYWLFGLPVFFLLATLLRYGLDVLNDKSLTPYRFRLRIALLWTIGVSLLFGFIFYTSEFPCGGNFGHSLAGWLMNFIGVFGVLLLSIIILVMLTIETHNPTLEGLTIYTVGQQLKESIFSIWDSRYRGFVPEDRKLRTYTKRKTADVSSDDEVEDDDEELEDTSLRTTVKVKDDKTPKSFAPIKSGGKTMIEEALNLPASVQLAKPPTADAFSAVSKTGNAPQTALRQGGTELEIEIKSDDGSEKSDDSSSNTEHVTTTPGTQANLFNDKAYGQIGTLYDPTLELSGYEFPVLPLLDNYEDQKIEIDRSELESNKDQIIETLLNYKIEITKIRATIGPTVTLYEIVPAAGVRISRIKNLEDDIALSLAALGIRIVAPIPGRGTIGIEVPNKSKQVVSLREVLSHERFRRTDMELPIALGKTISNEVFVADLTKMPHLLIAGATGQGKSVGINTILCSLLYKKHPSQLKLVLIDPKKVELSPYAKIENHFLAYLSDQLEPIITDITQVVKTLNSLVIEMEQRYDLLKKAQARNIKEYNEKFVNRKLNPEKGHRYMPFIVLVIDEFADLIMTAGKEIELPIGRLAQLSRAVGIHLIIATQRPSVNIITGVIKANFPARLAFKVASKVDSRTILDTNGADQLIGRGDMLLTAGSDIVRLQCAFVDTPEVERVINFIHEQPGFAQPYFLPEFTGDEVKHNPGAVDINDLDEMIDDAARLVVQNQHGSTSMIQRRLKLGYNRAGRIMDQLEHLGIVGQNEGSKPREVLLHDESELERFLTDLRNKKFK